MLFELFANKIGSVKYELLGDKVRNENIRAKIDVVLIDEKMPKNRLR